MKKRKFIKSIGKGIIILLPILFLFFTVKIVKIEKEASNDYILCFFNNKGYINFVNSVTGGDVLIKFKIKNNVFTDFMMKTDEKTENYYTSGLYNLNLKLEKEIEKNLNFCSVKGIKINVCGKNFYVKNNCIYLEVIWPPEKF